MIIDCKDFPTALERATDEFAKVYGRQPNTFQEASEIVTLALKLLVISKNKKYGKDNVNEFGAQGIFMRLWDKIQRLKQNLFKGIDLGEETALDTWGDVAGYGIVGILRENGWYDLPLKD